MNIHETTVTLVGGFSPPLPVSVADPRRAAVLEISAPGPTEPGGRSVCTGGFDVRAFPDGTLRVVAIDRDGQPCLFDNSTVRVVLLDGGEPMPIESPSPIAKLCCAPQAESPGPIAQTSSSQPPCPSCLAVSFRTPQVPGLGCCLGCWGAEQRAKRERDAQKDAAPAGVGRPLHPVFASIASRLARDPN